MTNSLRIGEKITELRKLKGITQDELATFLGVTKASVSKWETKQSYPDILLLPQIANFFGISTDVLLGYEPQISKEQIRKIYIDLANDFSNKPFDDVIEKCNQLVKQYYSCYEFIMQMAVLWLNHFYLQTDKSKQDKILNDIIGLCEHIINDSHNITLTNDAIIIKSTINLQLGNVNETIEVLENNNSSAKYGLESDNLLVQAYLMAGDKNKSKYYNQIFQYKSLLNLMTYCNNIIFFEADNKEKCQKTIDRTLNIVKTFDLLNLHPNITLQFYYACAVFYCMYQDVENAIENLSKFVNESINFIDNKFYLHGDDYFNLIDTWFNDYTLGTNAVRNKKTVFESIEMSVKNPALSILFENEKYKELSNKVQLHCTLENQ